MKDSMISKGSIFPDGSAGKRVAFDYKVKTSVIEPKKFRNIVGMTLNPKYGSSPLNNMLNLVLIIVALITILSTPGVTALTCLDNSRGCSTTREIPSVLTSSSGSVLNDAFPNHLGGSVTRSRGNKNPRRSSKLRDDLRLFDTVSSMPGTVPQGATTGTSTSIADSTSTSYTNPLTVGLGTRSSFGRSLSSLSESEFFDAVEVNPEDEGVSVPDLDAGLQPIAKRPFGYAMHNSAGGSSLDDSTSGTNSDSSLDSDDDSLNGYFSPRNSENLRLSLDQHGVNDSFSSNSNPSHGDTVRKSGKKSKSKKSFGKGSLASIWSARNSRKSQKNPSKSHKTKSRKSHTLLRGSNWRVSLGCKSRKNVLNSVVGEDEVCDQQEGFEEEKTSEGLPLGKPPSYAESMRRSLGFRNSQVVGRNTISEEVPNPTTTSSDTRPAGIDDLLAIKTALVYRADDPILDYTAKKEGDTFGEVTENWNVLIH